MDNAYVCVHLEVPVHEPLAVQEINSLRNLEKDIQTLVVFPVLWEEALSHPIFQVLLSTELHLDVQVYLRMGKQQFEFTITYLLHSTEMLSSKDTVFEY